MIANLNNGVWGFAGKVSSSYGMDERTVWLGQYNLFGFIKLVRAQNMCVCFPGHFEIALFI